MAKRKPKVLPKTWGATKLTTIRGSTAGLKEVEEIRLRRAEIASQDRAADRDLERAKMDERRKEREHRETMKRLDKAAEVSQLKQRVQDLESQLYRRSGDHTEGSSQEKSDQDLETKIDALFKETETAE